MKYRTLGRTSIAISEIVFGAGFVGGLFILGDDESRKKAIHRVIESGINWIDTAPVYGNGKSEEALGWLLSEIPKESRPYVSTKMHIDRHAGDFVGQVERSLEESFKRLKVNKIDLLHLHGAILSDPANIRSAAACSPEDVLRKGGVADAFDKVRSRGFFDLIGFTAQGETESIKQVIASERFDAAQVYYNLLNPSAGRSVPSNWSSDDYDRIIDECAKYGVGVFAFRVLAAGVIGSDLRHGRENPVGIKGDISKDEARMNSIRALFTEDLGSRGQVAIRYVLGNPLVSGALVGIADLDQLEEAIQASDLGVLPQSFLDKVHKRIDSDFGSLQR